MNQENLNADIDITFDTRNAPLGDGSTEKDVTITDVSIRGIDFPIELLPAEFVQMLIEHIQET